MKQKKTLKLSLAVCAGMLATQACADLADSARAEHWEASLRINEVQGDTYTSSTGAKAETDDSIGWGFSVGYNVNDNLTVAGSFNWSDVDYKAHITPGLGNGNTAFDVDATLQTSTINFGATYNILRKAVTPFVSGGFGATYVDTNIPNGPPVPVCWYDPWYGYYCGSAVPTKDETDFSYNVGAGLRWDAGQNFFLKASANKLWLDASGNIGRPSFMSYSVDFGLLFQ